MNNAQKRVGRALNRDTHSWQMKKSMVHIVFGKQFEGTKYLSSHETENKLGIEGPVSGLARQYIC